MSPRAPLALLAFALAALPAAAAPKAAPAPPAPPHFAELVRCGEAPGGWCVDPPAPPEKAVLVLSRPCRGVTLPQGRVKWTDCPRPEVGDLAVVGARVEGLRPLRLQRVSDPPTLARLEALMRREKRVERRLGAVESRLRKAMAAAGRPYEGLELSAWSVGGRGHLAVFDVEAEGEALPALIVKQKVTPLTPGPERCARAKDAFLAAGRAWLRLEDCPCGGEPCRAAFVPVD